MHLGLADLRLAGVGVRARFARVKVWFAGAGDDRGAEAGRVRGAEGVFVGAKGEGVDFGVGGKGFGGRG